MVRNRRAINPAHVVTVVVVCVLLPSRSVALPRPAPQHEVPDTKHSEPLAKKDLLGILDCATRPDQLLAVKPESYGGESFTLRYLYPVIPGRKSNMLNMFRPEHWAAIALYHPDGHSAALFEVGFDGPGEMRSIKLLDGANLEEQSGHWQIRNILNGGVSTWPEVAHHVNRLSASPTTKVARTEVTRSSATCEFPQRGQEFVTVSPTQDRSPWKFKDGISDGIKFKEQFGPFKNNDLRGMPFDSVFMISYGPS